MLGKGAGANLSTKAKKKKGNIFSLPFQINKHRWNTTSLTVEMVPSPCFPMQAEVTKCREVPSPSPQVLEPLLLITDKENKDQAIPLLDSGKI